MKLKLIVVLLQLLARLPLPMARAAGCGLGRLLWLLQTREAKVTAFNIGRCYPQKLPSEVVAAARKSMCHFGRTAFEVPLVWQRDHSWIESRVVAVTGLEYLAQAKAAQQGVLIIAPHHGNWEFISRWIAGHLPITALYEPPKNPALEPMMLAGRMRSGATLLPTNVRGVAGVIKALKRGEAAGILPDQVPPSQSGAFAPLFGFPAYTMTLIPNLLQKSSARALFCVALREGSGWHVHILPAEDSLYSGDQAQSLAALNRGVEQCVALAPEQYQWEYKRFKKVPVGAAPFYPRGV